MNLIDGKMDGMTWSGGRSKVDWNLLGYKDNSNEQKTLKTQCFNLQDWRSKKKVTMTIQYIKTFV